MEHQRAGNPQALGCPECGGRPVGEYNGKLMHIKSNTLGSLRG